MLLLPNQSHEHISQPKLPKEAAEIDSTKDILGGIALQPGLTVSVVLLPFFGDRLKWHRPR